MESSRLESEEQRQEGESGGIPVNKKKIEVLVAIDESEGSFYALKWALDHLFPSSPSDQQAQERPTFMLLHVQQPFQHYIFPAGPDPQISMTFSGLAYTEEICLFFAISIVGFLYLILLILDASWSNGASCLPPDCCLSSLHHDDGYISAVRSAPEVVRRWQL